MYPHPSWVDVRVFTMSDKKEEPLDIDMLHDRHPGLTTSLAGTYQEAASVCLDRHHNPPVLMEVCGSAGASKMREVRFNRPNDRTRNAWANDIDATEAGAYGVSLAAVEVEEGLVAVRRAETQTGADWYVAPVGSDPEDLEDCFRLEVSGVDSGNRSTIDTRLKQKINQTRRGASNLPAIASVVGFKEKIVLTHKVSEEK